MADLEIKQLSKELAATTQRLDLAITALKEIADPTTPLPAGGIGGTSQSNRAKKALQEIGEEPLSY